MARRFCLTSAREATDKNCSDRNDHFADGTTVFVDAYDKEYSRDIEPSKTTMGSYYFRLMKECIAKYRVWQLCATFDVAAGDSP
jgi:hypothetical protein